MAVAKVREYLKEYHMEDRILEFDVSSATVELAAQAVGCEPERIAKTIILYFLQYFPALLRLLFILLNSEAYVNLYSYTNHIIFKKCLSIIYFLLICFPLPHFWSIIAEFRRYIRVLLIGDMCTYEKKGI